MRSRKIRQAYRIGLAVGNAGRNFGTAILFTEAKGLTNRIERLACRRGWEKGREARYVRHTL